MLRGRERERERERERQRQVVFLEPIGACLLRIGRERATTGAVLIGQGSWQRHTMYRTFHCDLFPKGKRETMRKWGVWVHPICPHHGPINQVRVPSKASQRTPHVGNQRGRKETSAR